MKTMKNTILMACLMLAPLFTMANPFDLNTPEDTVIIELENGSRIIIYTRDKEELKRLMAYDINEMVKDLNRSVQEGDVEFMEITSDDGKKYLIDSPTVLFGNKMSEGDTIYVDERALDNIRIRVGGMELFLDPDELDRMDEDDFSMRKYSYVDRGSRSSTRNYFTMDFGVNNWLDDGQFPSTTDADYAVKPWGSWYVGLNVMNRTWVGGPLVLEWGGGFSWYNFKLENSDVQITKGDDDVTFSEVPDVAGLKSKISATYLNASFVPMLDFGKGAKRVKTTTTEGFTFRSSRKRGFRIGAGVYAGYRIGSTTKWIYKEDGNQDRIKERDHFFLENFRYGIRGQLGFGSFDMFMQYDLNEVFVEGRGPNGAQLNAFTLGIII